MSKSVYVAGSFKNLEKMQVIREALVSAGIETTISEPLQTNGIDGCLQCIREADITYILNFGGYVGKSVAMDIGYALGLGKPVYALEPIEDPDITHLLTRIVTPDEVIAELSGNSKN
ncbi:nucleotide pyrophosphohydrolase [Vibrio parahaemolyticus]|uniref:nucleotide pyrophosphohydrolase n=1 Tax=Vibrio parahaemolyticus TaxID=670 RepID=UPI00111E07BE|nr:nucleotide pyrophosphohydrolase [Vibrio parahaemolyticus]EGQ8107582.1 nucleotide pyrophosphohydrolase [Vibrio parahaemolyticus]EKA7417599.1 nucleotide pyrophosphohydrolase [Vibrio parahaemolyticus]ELA9327161.1 nucleotide pyrophosphohydrolase [Vibrio parahaemolyticus]TOM47177.1 nucleotide pyrophosphohydrolase [Vibrio parahaemolyticus]TOM63536.1 nucleotide pyrophosphohydrolase [Vibrio parahaemolyticus]